MAPYPTLVVGDLNIHHPSVDRLREHNSSELNAAFPYFSRATDHGYTVLKIPGVPTCLRLSGPSRPSVLDLMFASPTLITFFQDCCSLRGPPQFPAPPLSMAGGRSFFFQPLPEAPSGPPHCSMPQQPPVNEFSPPRAPLFLIFPS